MILRAQNQMLDQYMSQDRVSDRLQASIDYKNKVIDAHGEQLKAQVSSDAANRMAQMNAVKMADVSEGDRQRNYNQMMI